MHVGNVNAVTQTYTLSAPVDGEVLLRNINPGIEVQGQYSGGAYSVVCHEPTQGAEDGGRTAMEKIDRGALRGRLEGAYTDTNVR